MAGASGLRAGLFVISPVFLASIAGAISPGARMRYLTLGTVLVLALYSCWGAWWGGSTFGYRLILEVAPALVPLMPLAWTRLDPIRFREAR
jgi:hypothetical protein